MISDRERKQLKEWRARNREHIREYNKSRRHIVNAVRRERERADPTYKEKRRKEWQEWANRNKEKVLAAARARSAQYRLRNNFGLTLEEFGQMAQNQLFRCAICRKEEETIQKRHDGIRRRRTLSVDHDHETGKIRGLLCRQCNAGLGHFRDDPYLLRRALRYLRAFNQRSQPSMTLDLFVSSSRSV